MNQRIAIVSGIRTPFTKAGGIFNDILADDLGTFAFKELLARATFDPKLIDEVIVGNVMQPPHAANIARVIAVKSGVPIQVPAYTVNRNCASGLESITSGADRIQLGHAQVVLVGGVESMSNFPILFPSSMRDYLQNLKKAKGWLKRLQLLLQIRPSLFAPQMPGLHDPLCGLTMGQTAEVIIREFAVTRLEQDQFALASQQRASKAMQDGRFREEIVPVPIAPSYHKMQLVDDGPRANQTIEALQKLKPVFDPLTGTVTAGNSSQVTDGAVALLLMSESKAKQLGVQPLGYITAYASAGLDPSRMGLGAVYATAKLLAQTNVPFSSIDLIEVNEAFAGQVVAVMKAFASDSFARKALNRDKAIGKIDPDRINVNGGAIALGHPLGASGSRLVLTLLLELRKQKKRRGLVTLCIGGGQGQSCLLEVES